jgi:GH15 family glucan-1,4-alpha-glucosidase
MEDNARPRGKFVDRYDSEATQDGLPPGEGSFLACTFWLADCYVLLGREEDAQRTWGW